MHYYKKNIGDYAKKTGRLSMLQHGAYTLLIDSCYDRERFPTLEEAIDWTWASSKEEIEAVEFVLRKFFVLENGVYIQKRIKEELEDYKAKSENNKRIAQEREAKRKEKNTKRARTVNDSIENVNEAPPNQEPLTKNQEPLTKNQEPKNKKDSSSSGEPDHPMVSVQKIFNHWKAELNHPKARLDKKREAKIKSALKNYSIEECYSAIDGCKKTPWNMGENPGGTIYDDIELILRDSKNVEKFIRANESPSNPQKNNHNFDNVDYTYGVSANGKF